jgi:hypothetical protein
MATDLNAKLLSLLVSKRHSPGDVARVLDGLASGLSESSVKTAIASLDANAGAQISLKESFENLGLDAESADVAARGRNPDDQTLEESFQRLGMSPDAAIEAAKGRD